MGGLLLERLGWVRPQELGSRVRLRRPLEGHAKELGPPLNARHQLEEQERKAAGWGKAEAEFTGL